MKAEIHRGRIVLISYIVVLSILLTGCGATPTESPLVVVQSTPASENNGTYVNILINTLEFTGTVSNLGDTGNLQLIVVVSDDTGHSDTLICPYGSVVQVHKGDKIAPCKAGMTYTKNDLQGNLNIMLIAMDVKDKSALADIGTNVITSGLSTGLAMAIQGTSVVTPELAIGLIALGAVIGYAGNQTQEYFQRNYVIGSQSFTMSSQYHWNNGQPVSGLATNQQVVFNFSVQESSTASGQIVEDTSVKPAATTIPTAQPATNTTSAPVSLGTISVPGNSTVGKTFVANQAGVYSFQYVSGAYSTYPLDRIASAGGPTWLTALRVYQNRQQVWNGVAIVDEDYNFADHSYHSTQQEASQLAHGDQLSVNLNHGDYLVFVAVDGRPYYSDNPGEVTFEIFYQSFP